jgi:hypothetical protein
MKITPCADDTSSFDLDTLADERVRRDLAAPADRRATLRLDERPDPRIVADRAP